MNDAGRKTFVDTNVLVYAADRAYPEKRLKARSIITDLAETGGAVVSTQVLQELYVAATGKLRIPPDKARELVTKLAAVETVLVDVALIEAAMACSAASVISFWDALIVVSAAKAACAEVLTEDLNDGQIINGVRIRNPFK